MNVNDAVSLLEKGVNWGMPFPMGVFGTLRQGQWNNTRMHAGKVVGERKAFLPHFSARGLSIGFQKYACAPFEVFFYPSQEEWNKMIARVDPLEGFDPEWASQQAGCRKYGYWRTLAWLRLLPEDFTHELFKVPAELSRQRDLKIPQETWGEYERVPCWVYSSVNANDQAKQEPDCPVFWQG